MDPLSEKGCDEEIHTNFWEDNMYGGAIYEDVHILKEDGTIDREIGNNLEDKLKEDYDARDNNHGLFVIKNLHQYE